MRILRPGWTGIRRWRSADDLAAGMTFIMAVIREVSVLLGRIVIAVAPTQERGNTVVQPFLGHLSPVLIILVGLGFLIPTLIALLI